MAAFFPFMTTYAAPRTSEGTLDPLALYQIADQLTVKLVPAVRERMRRIRLLTAMAVGAIVTESLEENPNYLDASPYLIWEWLIVEAIVRQMAGGNDISGVPGRHMARRANDQHRYPDARSYQKTFRIFGFHGIYKRLAVHLGLVDVHLSLGPNTEKLAGRMAPGSGGLRDSARRSRSFRAGEKLSEKAWTKNLHTRSRAGF